MTKCALTWPAKGFLYVHDPQAALAGLGVGEGDGVATGTTAHFPSACHFPCWKVLQDVSAAAQVPAIGLKEVGDHSESP